MGLPSPYFVINFNAINWYVAAGGRFRLLPDGLKDRKKKDGNYEYLSGDTSCFTYSFHKTFFILNVTDNTKIEGISGFYGV
jgi:hypothetical protein